MMFRTHLVFGVFASLFFLKSFYIEHSFLFFFIVCISAILPDIDLPNSKIGRKTKPISWFINFIFGHRGIFHSLIFSFMFFILLLVLFENYIAAAFFIGYNAHLAIDGLTVRGIKPFIPFSSFTIRGPLRAGGLMDSLIFFLILVGIILLILS